MNKVSNNCYEVSRLEDINWKTLWENHGTHGDFIIDWEDGMREHAAFTDAFTVLGLTIRPNSEETFCVMLGKNQQFLQCSSPA